MSSQGHTVPRCGICGVPLSVDDQPYNACPPCLVREYPDDLDPPDPFEEDFGE